MTRCYLGLGSNLRSPERQIRQAITELRQLPRSVVTLVSSLYFSRPAGMRSQPTYCNMVIAMETSLPARRVLSYCQRIENRHQRLRKKHWGARTLDIDLLLYGKHQINNDVLIVPHPHMIHRDFVLMPLLEISPTTRLPTGEPLESFLAGCKGLIIR